MSNIHSIKSQGSGPLLGPVTITKVWPYKPGDKSINGNFQDGTGDSAFKIWGALPGLGLAEGLQLRLIGVGPKGAITNKEYPPGSGKWALNASDCRCELFNPDGTPYTATVGTVSSQASYAPPSQGHSAGAVGGLNLDQKVEMSAKQAARWTAAYIDTLVVNHGFSKDEAIMLGQGSSGGFPLFWFGEKGI